MFLGVYNADVFRERIELWLTRLDLQGTFLLISDNASTDSTLTWITPLAERMGVPFSIVRHKKNLGGYGNLASNLNSMTQGKWVTMLHQDDSYQPGHIQAHRRSLNHAPSNLGMIFSEARSVDEKGKVVPYPRAHWLFGDSEDPIRVFLAHVKHHVFPFSGATFSIEALRRFPVPYNSTAFPDTEIVMKMISDYDVRRARGVTVDYLENPISESHSLNSVERDLGAYQALIRVFSHSSFEKLCRQVPESKLPDFLRALLSGIDIRISHRVLASLLKQAAYEITAGHVEGIPLWTESVNERQSQRHSKRLIGSVNAARGKIVFPAASEDQGQLDSSRKKIFVSKTFGLGFATLLPRRLRQVLFTKLMSSSIGKMLLPQFDFDWDRL